MSVPFRFLVLCLLMRWSCHAGVVVTQNGAPGAIEWPGNPILQTVTNPAGRVAVGESFNSTGGCTNYTQTFTLGSAFMLQTVSIYAGGGTGTAVGTNLLLRLFDLGPQTAPNPSAYSSGNDLFNSGSGLSISYSPQPNGIVQFDFTGSDQVALEAGHMYAFEINGGLNTAPISWQRTTNDSYAAGAAYRNQSWINGNNARDFALAVYGASPGTNTATLVKVEAEGGTLGADWITQNVSPTNITITTDGVGDAPGSAARVATYSILFPRAGSYDLYARIRVGPAAGNDDSFFYGNGFGAKDATLGADWRLINGLGNAGFVNANTIVTGGGTAGAGVWKWINLSRFVSGPALIVPAGNLTQTFQIGAREDGLELDAFVFGINGVSYTVAELDAGAGGTFPDGMATLNWNVSRQRVDGFGAGVVFLDAGLSLTEANADKLFKKDTTNQLGLTLLRVRIAPNSNWSNSVAAWSGSLADAKRAVQRGAGVLATPWTPPASLKDTNSLVGGRVPPEQYATFAAYLDTYARYLRTNGAPLAAVSSQNEPDFLPDYESCLWNSSQFLEFCRNHAGAITNAPVMMPEGFGFNFAVSDATLNDPLAAANVAIIGGHLYGVNVINPYNNAHAKGKPTWMTEYLVNDQTIETAVDTAAQIHDCLTAGNMSAYIWWKCLGNANGLLNAAGVIQKRGYVMAQFSRFARPGDYRIAETNLGSSRVSAWKNTGNTRFAIIALNPYSLDFTQTVVLSNFPGARLTPWITSATQSLAIQPSFVVTNNTLTFNLPANSVVTFAGETLTNVPPLFATVPPRTVNPGMTVLITNAVTDPDAPEQTLSFSLLTAPTNATLTSLNASNALFTWRPTLSQAGSAHTIQVKVADNGTPGLSATNAFVITVNQASAPTLGSLVLGNDISLSATGMIGPDYSLFTSTNLGDWRLLFTTNPTAMPVTFTDTNRNDAARFYWLQLGP
jgi:glucuronoarabinoxylan endo-1,4-beta-xylanase